MMEVAKGGIDVLLGNPGIRVAAYHVLGNNFSTVGPPSLAGLFTAYGDCGQLRHPQERYDLMFSASPSQAAHPVSARLSSLREQD